MTSRTAWVIGALVIATTAGAQERPAAGVSGRWAFELPVLLIQTVGAAATDTSEKQQMILDLRTGPHGVLTGTVSVGLRMPLTVVQPWHRVEIAQGTVNGNAIAFKAWRYDQYRSELRYEGVLEGDTLQLTVTRETPAGSRKTQVVAKRSAY